MIAEHLFEPAAFMSSLNQEWHAWSLAICQKAGVRRTAIREKLLHFFSHNPALVSLDSLATSSELAGLCDATTLYRNLILLRDLSILRQIHFPGRTTYFALNYPGRTWQFLICQSCEKVIELSLPSVWEQMASQVIANHGFKIVHQETEVFGICPSCQKTKRPGIPPCKLSR